MGAVECLVRQADVAPIGVVHGPEHVAPGAVQRIWRLVALGQPVAESVLGRVRVGQGGGVAGVFVVGLPGGDMRVLAITLGQSGNDLGTFGAIAAM